MLICVGGIHGNEPAGVEALERVVEALRDHCDQLTGDFVAFVGNRRALKAGKRFLSHDLNRAWSVDTPWEGLGDLEAWTRASANGEDRTVEELERQELQQAFAEVVAQARGKVFILDLHTTSGGGGAFTTVGDSLVNRSFALNIPVPLVLGLEELVRGTLVGYLSEYGFTTAVFECGQHEEVEASKRAEAAVWLVLRGAGLLAAGIRPEVQKSAEYLGAECRYLPRVLEMRYRHGIRAGDAYRTSPGFRNFQPIETGQVMGRDRNGAVTTPEGGRVLMPLYQVQGEDGFFVVREFSQVWLWISRVLRVLGVAKIAHWLPGVYRESAIPNALAADRRVARWYALELFHLLGYRRHLEEGDRLVVVGRPVPRQLPGRLCLEAPPASAGM